MSLKNFIKEIDTTMHDQYVMEKFGNRTGRESHKHKADRLAAKVERPVFSNYPLKKLQVLTKCSAGNQAKQFVRGRMIPAQNESRLYHCTNFRRWLQDIDHPKKELKDEHQKLIIPFFDADNRLTMIQARALDEDDKIRYMTIKFIENAPKIFGLDRVDFSRTNYVVEGPLDAMFIQNSIAMAGADVSSYDHLLNHNTSVFVYDNERRNTEILNRMMSRINDGWKVCFWSDAVREKDINDMVLAGMNTMNIKESIDRNTYQGLHGVMKMKDWRKA
jgi:hypothetical protein